VIRSSGLWVIWILSRATTGLRATSEDRELFGRGFWQLDGRLAAVFTALCVLLPGPAAVAQDSPFAPGWDLDPATSFIRFSSIKNVDGQDVVETHSFATFASSIEADGKATINVKLESVDTRNDLRNVRMRFLFFETFKFPEAVVTAQLTPDMAAGLAPGGQKQVQFPFTMEIHGASNRLVTDAIITPDGNDRFVATSAHPILFKVDDFQLGNNLRKIAETAGGFTIVPEMNITYQFTFNRRVAGAAAQVAEAGTVVATPPAAAAEGAAEAAPAAPQPSAALETQGEFSYEECVGRFEILSETGNIYFASGSARLDQESDFMLGTVVDIVQRCPGLRLLISGHTDDDGSDAYNQALSEKRAQSVVDYLASRGVDRRRLYSAGFGEAHPMVPNDSAFNKGRNRRIEFSLYK
jgi:outer membrane protein OmpA-like peptidoglycan-associated protein/polyisoprenoid-binding protein YceI